ncbi:hypothetical protein [Echinicola sp. 20G]|uniref:hypothetical protein n=1 Tax=Echinicola sp. 20G TaxID=2781961 RepID=UPI001910B747|nr:hypothetical protein [Echinicola sp. 20G]
MKTMRNNLLAGLLFATSITLVSCSKDDPVPELDQEVITEVTLTFTEIDNSGASMGTSLEYGASSDEGIALGGSLQIDDIDGLESGKRYLMEISAYNGIADEDITEEIEEEADEHQFFFLGSAFTGSTSFMTYTYDDVDENNNPIGLVGQVTVDETLLSNTGQIRVILRHALDKDYEGAENPHWADYAQAGGESDLDITFDVTF